MADSITLRLTHTGLSQSSLLLADLQGYKDSAPLAEPKAGPVYVPVGQSVDILFTDRVSFSYLNGTIAGFIALGHLTAQFLMDGLLQAASEAETHANGNLISTMQFYNDAVPIGAIRRRTHANNQYGSSSMTVRVTTTGAETIDVRVVTSASN